ncbi:MAG TPA: DUF5067 domain-containing protein [Fastidiosipila sp.]|nr:DUF5067 domain-containing protein [Fastidiosipila sp.]
MRTLKNYLPGTGMLKALSVLLAVLLLLFGAAGEVWATEVETAVEDETEQELTPVEAYIFEYLAPWQNTTIVNEFFLSSGKILQLHIIEPLTDQGDEWYAELSKSLARLLDEFELDHERLFIDFIDAEGARIDAFDIDLNARESLHAWFESADEGATGEATDLNQTITLPEAEITLTRFELLEDQGNDMVKIYANFKNLSNEVHAFLTLLTYDAEQDQLLTKVFLGEDEREFMEVEPGEMIEDIVLGFFVDDLTLPLTITFKQTSDDKSESVDIDLTVRE